MPETKLYRIYTEDKNRESIFRILDASFSGYTVIPAIGVWKGKQEASLVIEIISTPTDPYITFVADRIKFVNRQEAILITETEVKSELR